MNTPKPPTRATVVKALERYKSAKKVRFRLKCSEVVENCFCIEGVFCAVAEELGFDGTFAKDMFYYADKQKYACTNAPAEVFAFLGVPRTVELSVLDPKTAASLKHESATLMRLNKTERPAVFWHALNDRTTLKLPEIIDLVVKTLNP